MITTEDVTKIFDSIIEELLSSHQDLFTKTDVVEIITYGLLDIHEEDDWQEESKYFEHPVVKRHFTSIWPHWYADGNVN